MGIIIRQGLKASTVAYLGVAIGAWSSLWVMPQFLTTTEMGILRLLQDISFLCAGLMQLGASNIIDKFLPVFFDKSQKHNGFLAFMFVYTLIGLCLFLGFFLGFQSYWMSLYEEKSPELQPYFSIIIPLGILTAYSFFIEAYSRGHLRIAFPTFFREVLLKLWVIFIILLYGFHFYGFDTLVNGLVLGYGLLCLLLVLYLLRLGIMYVQSFDFQTFSTPVISEIGWYGFYILLGGMSSLIIMRIDTLMIGSYLGASETGIYSIAFFIGTVIEIPRRSLAQISTPLIAQAWKKEDFQAVKDIYKKSSLHMSLVAVYCFLGVWSNIDEIFSLIPHAEIFREAKWVVFWIALTRVTDMSTGLNSELLLQSQYYRFNLLLTVFLALLLVVSNMIFIPLRGMEGAALATFLSVFIWNLIKLGFIWFWLRMGIWQWQSLLIFIWGVLVYAIVYCLPSIHGIFLSILVKGGFITLCFALFIGFIPLSPEITKLKKIIINRIGWKK